MLSPRFESKNGPLRQPSLTLNRTSQFPKGAQGIGGVSNGLLLTSCWPTLEYRRVPLRLAAHWRTRDSRQSRQVSNSLQFFRAQLASFLNPIHQLNSISAMAANPGWRGVHLKNLRRRDNTRKVQAKGKLGVLNQALVTNAISPSDSRRLSVDSPIGIRCKINLEKIRNSLKTVCPHCSSSIPPKIRTVWIRST